MKRGSHKFVTTMRDEPFTSRFSGNVTELCPVGALTSRVSRFRARPWDMRSQKSICTRCSNGCSIWLDYRPGRLMRVLGRENSAVNEEWTCDNGKFGYENLNTSNRIKQPLVRVNGKFTEVSWADAYTKIAAELSKHMQNGSSNAVGLIAGSTITNEGAYVMQNFLRSVVGSGNIDAKMTPGRFVYAAKPGDDSHAVWMDVTIEQLEKAKKIVIIGSDIIDEQPIVFLRVRKAAMKSGTSVVFINEQDTESSQRIDGCDNITVGEGAIPEMLDALKSYFETGSASDDVVGVANLLKSDDTVILCGADVLASAEYPAMATAVETIAKSCSAKVGMMVPGANSFAMGLLGVTPDKAAMGTEQMLQAAAAGEIKTLFIDSCDLVNTYSDKSMADKALQNVGMLVVRDTHLTETAEYADVVLPAASLPELEGTMTNVEGRVQQLRQAYKAPGYDTRSALQFYMELAAYVGKPMPVFSAAQVLSEISKAIPQFAEIDTEKTAASGQLLLR